MKYIFAVSGGPDSMAMLHMFYKKAQAVCVVNYKKRKNSDYDVSLVTEFCNLHNIKYYVHNVTPNFYKKHKNMNFQSLAREIRYKFFQKVAKIEKNHNLMIAHNLNDHLETAYMQFSRKSRGLFYGIPPKTVYKDLKIKKPLIKLQKSTILRYCKENNIKYAVDYTNEMDIYERNRVRKIIFAWNDQEILEFIKKIKKYNKKNKKISKLVSKNESKWIESKNDLQFLLKLDYKIQYHLIYNFLKKNGEKNNSSNKIENIISFLKKINLSNKYRLENDKYLKLSKINNQIIIKVFKK